jgi:hypothetical protein
MIQLTMDLQDPKPAVVLTTTQDRFCQVCEGRDECIEICEPLRGHLRGVTKWRDFCGRTTRYRMRQSGEGPPKHYFWGDMDRIVVDEYGDAEILGGEE